MAKAQDSDELNSQWERKTHAYYNEHAVQYARKTAMADLTELYEHFLPLLPEAGYILDVGCGGGRDMRVFKEHGFSCLGIDAVPRLVKIAQTYSRCRAIIARVEDIHFDEVFDGAWACASLLHLPRKLLPVALARIRNALKGGGTLFLSMQEGVGEKTTSDGRFFARYLREELHLLISLAGFVIIEQWPTRDVLPGREGLVWLNVVAKKPAVCSHLWQIRQEPPPSSSP